MQEPGAVFMMGEEPVPGITPGAGRRSARQPMLVDLHRGFCAALLTMDAGWLHASLAGDVEFESQACEGIVRGRADVIARLAGEFGWFGRAGRHPELWLAEIEVPVVAGQPCLLVDRGTDCFLIRLTAAGCLVERIDVLTVMPVPTLTRRIERLR